MADPTTDSPAKASFPIQQSRSHTSGLGVQQEPPRRALTVEDLFAISSTEQPSTALSGQHAQVSQDEIKIMYLNEYGKGMNLFLETDWYTDKGLDYLLQDPYVLAMFRSLLELFANTKVNDYENFFKLPQIEARVTWALLCLPRIALTKLSSEPSDHKEVNFSPDLDRVLRRLSVFEHLITNRNLPYNPLADSSHSSADVDGRQLEFWRELGHFITIQKNSDDDCGASLLRLRKLLDGLESRDVLYSMAVVRCGAMVSNTGNTLSSARSDGIIVARKFIEDEAASKGTTQVVQRLCGMAVRSWAVLQ